jgi:hypothetical protein
MKNTQISICTAAALALNLLLASRAAANTALWIGNPGVSVTTNWSDNANWNNIGGGGVPGALQNDVRFGGAGSVGGAATINNVADTGQHPLSITFTNGPGQFHTTLIPAGVIVTNDNNFIVGGLLADAYTTRADFQGDGTLVQNGNTMTIQNYGNTVSTALATLDLSGLNSFVFNASGGTLTVGGTGGNRSAGALNLASVSNYITAGTLNLGTGSGANAATSNLRLGAGTNIINIGTFGLVNNKNTATFTFLSGSGGLRLRGVGGTDADRVTIVLANRNQTGTGTTTGNLSLNGHPVDIKAGTITVGQNSAGSSVNIGTGVIQFDTGVIDATNIVMAVCSNPGSGAGANGTITVGSGGTLIIGAGGLSLVNRTGAAATATGNLNINGGTVTCANNIIKTTSAASTGNITMTGGSLTLAPGKTIGTTAIPIDNLNLTSAALSFSVVGGLTPIVATTVNVLDAANTITVTALPSIGGFPTQLPIVNYTTYTGSDLGLNPLPGGFSGYLSNDVINTVWLVVTNGTILNKPVQWGGAFSSLWETSSLNWTNSGVATNYSDGDFVTFNDSAQTGNVSIIGTRQPTTLSISNSALNYVFSSFGRITGGVALTKDGAASVTFSETGVDNFFGGIFVTNGTVVLDNTNGAITGGLVVYSGGTVQIGNNNGNGNLPGGSVFVDGALKFNKTTDLTVGTSIAGAGTLTKLSSGKVTLTASNSYSGNTIVTVGTLALGGGGSIGSSAEVSVSGAALDLTAVTGVATLTTLDLTNANLSLAMPNVTTPLNVNALNMGGAGNTINLSSLPPAATYPTTITLVQSATPIVGFNATAGTFPAGVPAYAGSVSLSGDQLSIRLTLTAGPVGVRTAVFWSGGASPNTNWTQSPNWLTAGAPSGSESAVFNSSAVAGTSALTTPGGGTGALDPNQFNNAVDTSFLISSLIYSNVGGTYHNTHLESGRTLSMTNTLTVGAIDAGGTATTEGVSISGNGAVSVSNTNASVQVWLGNGSANNQATLDMSALDSFTANISRLAIGAAAVNNAVNRPSGILYLAKTNAITTGFQTTTVEAGTTTGNAGIVIGDCNQNAGPASAIHLGIANTITADTIGVARQKTTGTLKFNSIYANVAPYPTLTVQGFSSSRVSVFDVGSGVGNTGTTTGTGTADFSGGIVNILADTMSVGRGSTPASGTSGGTTTGILTFDAGSINVNTLNVGLQPAAANNLKVGIGTVNVGTNTTIGTSGTLVVNGTLNLAVNAGSPTTAGTLNITGGTIQAANIAAGTNGAASTVTVNDGSLIVTGTAGTPTAPLTTLNLTGGKLRLNVDGNATTPALVATAINPSGTTTLNIGAVANVTGSMTLPLISYTGTDPYASLALGTVPAGYNAFLVDNTGSSTIDITITNTIPPALPRPTITRFAISGPALTIQGTNGANNGQYVLLGSTNVSLQLTLWSPVMSNVFAPDGSFNVTTNVVNPAVPRQFYILRQ